MAEINARIEAAGKALPDWWDAGFTPPAKLDVTGAVKGWKPQENIGTHMFIVCPRPDKWKYAIQLMDIVIAVNTDERMKHNCVVMKGDMYARLEDWPRAAYWWRQAGVSGSGDQPYGLVRCLWKMGARTAAVEALSAVKADTTRCAKAIRLWSEMGETDRALALAEASLQPNTADIVGLAAGDACRRAGRFDDAEAWYRKALALTAGTRDLKQNQRRAQASLAAVTKLKQAAGATLNDGTYAGQGQGYRGPVDVEVVVKGGRIASAAVKRQRDDRAYDAMRTVPARIVAQQGVPGVDTVSGATISSEAVLNAAAEALAKAAAKP